MNQRRTLMTEILILGATNLLLVPMISRAPQATLKHIVLINIFGMSLIGLRVIQAFIDRSRGHYNIKTVRHHVFSISVWWGGAIMAGLLMDIAMMFLDPSEHPWLLPGTILFAALGLVIAPLYLAGEWWASRKK